MRHLLCKECGKRYPESGVKTLFPRSKYGEPAEIARIVKGTAGVHNDCDGCGTEIKPGDEVTCLSVWTDNRPEIPAWEHEFIES